MNAEVYKVTAYITRMYEGKHQLLVFQEQDYEHLGLQVPGGTVEVNEALMDALRREIKEEAGMDEIDNIVLLGEHSYYLEKLRKNVHRYYYQLEADAPDAFTHIDTDNGWTYHYSWIDLDSGPILYDHLGVHLEKVKQLA